MAILSNSKIFDKAINIMLEVTQLVALGKEIEKSENINSKIGYFSLTYFVLSCILILHILSTINHYYFFCCFV